MKKIVIAEDEDLQRKYLVQDILEKRPDRYQVVAEAVNGVELIANWKRFNPDILIVDLNLPLKSGYAAIEEIRESDKKVIIIVLTHVHEKAIIEGLFELVNTFLIKDKETPEGLINVLDQISEYHSSFFKPYILSELSNQDRIKSNMTFREFQVFSLLKARLTNQEIADKLFLTVKAIEKINSKLYKLYNVKNRVELLERVGAKDNLDMLKPDSPQNQ